MTNCGYKLKPRGMTGGWEPVGDKPVLGGALGTCFDCYVMKMMEYTKYGFPGDQHDVLLMQKARMEFIGTIQEWCLRLLLGLPGKDMR